MRILVVEDELHLQKTICKRLEMEHYSVDACDNGLEALDYIEMTPYDIIILDIYIDCALNNQRVNQADAHRKEHNENNKRNHFSVRQQVAEQTQKRHGLACRF